MKTFVLSIVLLFVVMVANSQAYYESKVLNLYFVGFDSMEQIKEKSNFDELNVYSDELNGNHIDRITLNNQIYKNRSCKIVMLLVNNTLYGVQYYPLKDRTYYMYIKVLDNKYHKTDSWNYNLSEVEWANNTLVITKELSGTYEDYFTHYNKEMLKKYPQYKNF